ncbi:hypothetical protein MJT46_008301 [Ovis ammon polii x Ovis aries]|nr:hypothetical protein MJT46_008301 [Ovis ammon polii x Ovis aries]
MDSPGHSTGAGGRFLLPGTERRSPALQADSLPAEPPGKACCCCCQVASLVSDSVRPRPWDSPGKNTGVGCHVLLQCRKVKVKSLSRIRRFARPHGLQPTKLLRPLDFPGKSTGVGCHCLLRGKPYRKSKRNQFLSHPCS